MDNQFCVGIDIDDENAIVSYSEKNKKEPETLSMVAGSEVYQIPVCLAKKKGMGQWFIGDEARHLAVVQGENCIGNLLSKALNGEKVFVENEKYPAKELLQLFLKKLIRLTAGFGLKRTPDVLVICLAKLSREAAELFLELAPNLGVPVEHLILLDRKECFYYFAYHQEKELSVHDVVLFDYRGDAMRCNRISCNRRTVPQMITIDETVHKMGESDADSNFLRIAQDTISGHIASAVYLVGDGFDGSWMKQSVAYLCKGRRVFVGKNLYAKGACYAADVLLGNTPWEYVYLGDNEMKMNVSLKVKNHRKEEFYTLISAGDNWYESRGECEVILAGTPEIAFWLQEPGSREAKIEKLELSDLPKRPDATTRLRIVLKPLSDCKVQITIKDLGFGEFFKSSDKVWEYHMTL